MQYILIIFIPFHNSTRSSSIFSYILLYVLSLTWTKQKQSQHTHTHTKSITQTNRQRKLKAVFLLPCFSCIWGLWLLVFHITTIMPLKKIIPALPTAINYIVLPGWGWTLCLLSLFSTDVLSGLNFSRSCARCYSLWEFICSSDLL